MTTVILNTLLEILVYNSLFISQTGKTEKVQCYLNVNNNLNVNNVNVKCK